ncbi:hypothetical protein CLF_110686 [Clonorchis sinensis]|uniref:Endonuclease/exonuclease/phosphatase domain-containing protein n=1 Tax=Clonorchis sinensis TaxID=79923 RepID=G7YTR6_CLOSI|nr:hypothetical protein CLF_110686 [Clonorchis sinensis]
MNTKLGHLSCLESHLGGRFGVDARHTHDSERLFQLCVVHQLFLVSMELQHKRSRHVTWCSPTANEPRTQLDHVAISHRWRATIQDCRSLWVTQLHSDHAMVRARLTVRFHSGSRNSGSIQIHHLRRNTTAQQIRSELAQQLTTVTEYCTGSTHVDEAWQNVKGATQAASSAVCPTSPIRRQDHWMSSRSLSMIDARKSIPAGNEYDAAR